MMETAEHVAALEMEGELLLAAAAAAGSSAAVPTCPGWQVRDLLAHVGYVHRWATAYVSEAIPEQVGRRNEAAVLAGAPSDELLVDWVAEGHRALVEALVAAPADLRCWQFLPAPSPLAFWARRQAHETAIHRVDAELAAGSAITPGAPAFAADGIDELLLGFFSRRSSRIDESVEVTLGLEASDCDRWWSVHLGDGRVAAGGEREDCDVIASGSAFALYRLCWNRRPPVGLLVSGKAELLEAWHQHVTVTWR